MLRLCASHKLEATSSVQCTCFPEWFLLVCAAARLFSNQAPNLSTHSSLACKCNHRICTYTANVASHCCQNQVTQVSSCNPTCPVTAGNQLETYAFLVFGRHSECCNLLCPSLSLHQQQKCQHMCRQGLNKLCTVPEKRLRTHCRTDPCHSSCPQVYIACMERFNTHLKLTKPTKSATLLLVYGYLAGPVSAGKSSGTFSSFSRTLSSSTTRSKVTLHEQLPLRVPCRTLAEQVPMLSKTCLPRRSASGACKPAFPA